MKTLSSQTVWVIVSKDRKYIAKGTPRNRHLIPIDDDKDKKRILTYSSKGRAESKETITGFYGQDQLEGIDNIRDDVSELLEAVECKMELKIVE